MHLKLLLLEQMRWRGSRSGASSTAEGDEFQRWQYNMEQYGRKREPHSAMKSLQSPRTFEQPSGEGARRAQTFLRGQSAPDPVAATWPCCRRVHLP